MIRDSGGQPVCVSLLGHLLLQWEFRIAAPLLRRPQ